MSNEIVKLEPVLQEMGLKPAESKTLLEGFGELYVQAHKLSTQSKMIEVKDESDVAGMNQAKEARVELMRIRKAAEKIKTDIKKPYLLGAQAAQNIFNDIKKVTQPEENRLKEQEKFAELAEAKRVDERYVRRVNELSKYVVDVSVYSLREMPGDTFDTLLTECKKAHDDRVAAEKIEEEKIAKAKASMQIFEQRQLEMAPFGEFMKGFLLEVETGEKRFQEELAAGKKAKSDYDAEREKINKDNKKLMEEREKAEKAKVAAEKKLADEKKAQREKEQKAAEEKLRIEQEAREAKEAQVKAEADEQRKILMAPDKEKLIEFAATIDKIQLPAVKSNDAGVILAEAKKTLDSIGVYIREKSKSL